MNELKKFRIANACLWAAIALFATSVATLRESLGLGLDFGLLNLLSALPFLILAGLAYKISRCVNWARITYLVIFVCWLFPAGVVKSLPIFLIFNDIQYFIQGGLYMLAASLSLVSLLLHVAALYLFFSCHTSRLFQEPCEIAGEQHGSTK